MDDNEIHKTGYARYPRFREAFHLLLPSLLLCPQPGILSVSASSYDPNRKQRYGRSVAIKSAPEGSERAGPFVSPLHFLSLETFALGRPRDRPKTRNRLRRWPGGNGSCPRVQTNGTIEWKITISSLPRIETHLPFLRALRSLLVQQESKNSKSRIYESKVNERRSCGNLWNRHGG